VQFAAVPDDGCWVAAGSVGALDGSTVRHRQTYKRTGREGMAEGLEVAMRRRERADVGCYTADLTPRIPTL
jgi:hypothetical protein